MSTIGWMSVCRFSTGRCADEDAAQSASALYWRAMNLEVAIDYVYQQRLIPKRFTVDELFDGVTRKLDG